MKRDEETKLLEELNEAVRMRHCVDQLTGYFTRRQIRRGALEDVAQEVDMMIGDFAEQAATAFKNRVGD